MLSVGLLSFAFGPVGLYFLSVWLSTIVVQQKVCCFANVCVPSNVIQ